MKQCLLVLCLLSGCASDYDYCTGVKEEIKFGRVVTHCTAWTIGHYRRQWP